MNTSYTPNYTSRIGNVIRFVRISKSLKQEYLAHKSGYSNKSTYSKLESGQIKHIDITKFIKICEVFEIEPHKVLFLSEQEIFTNPINSLSELLRNIQMQNGLDNTRMLEIIKDIFPIEFQLNKGYLFSR